MSDPLENYFSLARKASFHYADDSGKEWDLAGKAKRAALEIFDAHPELHKEMRAIQTLWSLTKERPVES